jgi:hypothetical protein
MIWVVAKMPCFRALKRDAAFPSVVRGPVDFCEFMRFAAVSFAVGIMPLSI